MKKKLAVIIIFIFGIFIVVGNLCKPTDFSIEGKVIEKYEKAFLLETDTSVKYFVIVRKIMIFHN